MPRAVRFAVTGLIAQAILIALSHAIFLASNHTILLPLWIPFPTGFVVAAFTGGRHREKLSGLLILATCCVAYSATAPLEAWLAVAERGGDYWVGLAALGGAGVVLIPVTALAARALNASSIGYRGGD